VKDENKIFSDILLEAITRGSEESLNLWKSFSKDDGKGEIVQSVPWTKFIVPFLDYLGIVANSIEINDNLEIECIKETLGVNQNNQEVTLKNYEKFLKLFPPVNKGLDYLHQIKELLKSDWFFGEIDPNEATGLLDSSKRDCFMVRFSSSTQDCYTISYKKGKSITHNRIPTFDIHGQIKTFRKKNHMKPVSGLRPYAKLFDDKLKKNRI